ncbi:MAG: metallophosphoesterase [bacterium]
MSHFLFIFTFLAIYGGIHAYAYSKVQSAFHLTSVAQAVLLMLMALMVSAPILIHLLNKRGLTITARFAAYLGFTWMGFLFLFFSIFLAADLYNLLARLVGTVFRYDSAQFALAGRSSFFLLALLVVAVGCYSIFDAQRIRTERVVLTTSKLPEGVKRVTMVQITDVHLSPLVSRQFLEKLIGVIRDAGPDILVSTGDLVDMEISQIMDMADLFQEIKPRYGKFAIMGNHDFYAGIDAAMDFTTRAGFRVLRGEGITVAGILNMAGVDDHADARFGQTTVRRTEREILASLPQGPFTVFLKHRPDVMEDSTGLFDLQLSGHTHGGQIFPFTWIIHFFYPMQNGLYTLPPHCYLYTNTGAGTWGPPMRFLAPPRITVIEINNTEPEAHYFRLPGTGSYR